MLFTKVTCNKIYFQSSINNQKIYLKIMLHNYILYKGHHTFEFSSYLDMALIFHGFLTGKIALSKTSRKSEVPSG